MINDVYVTRALDLRRLGNLGTLLSIFLALGAEPGNDCAFTSDRVGLVRAFRGISVCLEEGDRRNSVKRYVAIVACELFIFTLL